CDRSFWSAATRQRVLSGGGFTLYPCSNMVQVFERGEAGVRGALSQGPGFADPVRRRGFARGAVKATRDVPRRKGRRCPLSLTPGEAGNTGPWPGEGRGEGVPRPPHRIIAGDIIAGDAL